MRQIRKIGLLAVGDSAWQGGIQYITNILNALNEVGIDNNLEVHLFRRAGQHFNDLDQFTHITLVVHLLESEISPFTLTNRIYWLVLRKLAKRINPQLENYFCSLGLDYIFPATLSNCGNRLNAGAWIADFQYHHFPDGHSKETAVEAVKTISFIVDHADKIILSSEFCEKDCAELFPAAIHKVHVMPFAVFINKTHLQNESLNLVREKYGVEGPYIMVSNLFGETKNHKTLFQALGILRQQGLKITCVCTGNFVNYAKMEFTNEVLQIITDTHVRDQLFILGLIPRVHQVALYRMACALVQPSMHEGWSTLVEEAKALGKLILLSNIDVHREQYPDNPHFFDTTNPVDLAAKLRLVYEMQQGKTFPELDVESNAFSNYRGNVRAFGKRFLEIASR